MSMNYTHGFPPMEDSLLTPFERMQRALARADYDLIYRKKLQQLRILQLMLFKTFANPSNNENASTIILDNSKNSIFINTSIGKHSNDEIYKIPHSSIVSNKAFFQENFSKKNKRSGY